MNLYKPENDKMNIKQSEEGFKTVKGRFGDSESPQKEILLQQKVANRILLSGGAAHDVNTILQTIQDHIKPALKGKFDKDPNYYQSIVKIGSLVERGSKLVNQLLTINQKTGPELSPVNLNSITKEVHRYLEKSLAGGITIKLDLADDLYRINADEGQIGQVVLYLSLNAGDTMPAGGVLTIGTQNGSRKVPQSGAAIDPAPISYVVLTVTGTGRAIPHETLSRAFPCDPITGIESGEMGHRLKVVDAIVKSHGGFIDCAGRKGEGNAFQIHLPAANTENVENRAGSGKGSSDMTHGNQTILIVDDIPEILDTGKQYLQRFGYRVITAKNGSEAVSKYKKFVIDVVVLDIGLPDMNGLSCLSTLKQLNQNANIIISTGMSVENDEKKAMDLGAAAFLAKPYTLRNLLTTIKQIIDGS